MKRRIYHYLAILLFICFSVSSCTEMEMKPFGDSMYIELKVSCVNLNETRATMAGVDALNENKIESLHYFLYPTNGTNQNAVLAGKIGANKLNGTTIKIPLNEGILNEELIPYPNTSCEVFLIANLPDAVSIDTDTRQNTSLAELEDKVVVANFKLTADGKPAPQPSFVMTGKGVANLINRKQTNAVEGTIDLQRLAAKYTVRISVDETFTDNGVTWSPDVNNMTVHTVNAVKETKLSGETIRSVFSYDDRKYTSIEDNKYTFYPFYSYPCEWGLREENAFAVFIMLPWKRTDNENQFTPHYYKVFPNTTQLERNCWYNVDLHIGVLGSLNPTEADVILEPNYSVMDWNNGSEDWSTGVDENTSIQGARYLIVDQNHYVVNNQDEFEIPFTSSHDCIIKDLSITRTEFGTTNTSTPHPVEIKTTTITENIHYRITNDNTAIVDDAIKLEGKTIKLKHTLNNDFINSKTYDYTPYTITFTLCHKDNPEKFKETITITQKPALTVTAHLNSRRENGSTAQDGYQFVNGRLANSSGSGDYGGAYGLYQSHNKNPYMYVIEVSVLPDGSEFILGDPRSTTPATDSNRQDLDFGNFKNNAPGVEGSTSRKLTNYYYTQKDVSVENMLAPKFRIASSHSVVRSYISYNDAYNRTATYQEDGYPAGRWRVPTKAEVHFVVKLFIDGKIPPLFSPGTGYWCSTGKVTPNNDGTVKIEGITGGDVSTRPIYDEWYWEHSNVYRLPEDKRNTFTWGDEI